MEGQARLSGAQHNFYHTHTHTQAHAFPLFSGCKLLIQSLLEIFQGQGASERAALCSADLKYSKWSEETKLGDASEQIRGHVFSCRGPNSFIFSRAVPLFCLPVGSSLKFQISASKPVEIFWHRVIAASRYPECLDVTVET